jgi:RHS repeat-associated protein
VRRHVILVSALAVLLVPAAAHGQETVEYYGTDGLGSLRIVFDGSGGVISRAEYMPFGEEVFAPGQLPRQRFTGQERDGEVGLDYFHVRMFQPRTGRLSSPDPRFSRRGDPQGWNRYSYVRNSPTLFVDPTGMMVAGPPAYCPTEFRTCSSGDDGTSGDGDFGGGGAVVIDIVLGGPPQTPVPPAQPPGNPPPTTGAPPSTEFPPPLVIPVPPRFEPIPPRRSPPTRSPGHGDIPYFHPLEYWACFGGKLAGVEGAEMVFCGVAIEVMPPFGFICEAAVASGIAGECNKCATYRDRKGPAAECPVVLPGTDEPLDLPEAPPLERRPPHPAEPPP